MTYWTKELVGDLIELKSGESLTLELKATVPEFSDRGKAELLKDITAFANSSGGTILYGIAEEDGCASGLSGLRLSETDELIRRIHQLVESGVEPRMPNLKVYVVSLLGGDVLVIEVPQLVDGPRRFKFNNNYRFVQRHERHIGDLSYDQLKGAFTKSEHRIGLIDKIWRDEFGRSSFWNPMRKGAKCVLKYIPISAVDGQNIIDPTRVEEYWNQFMMPSWGGASPGYNYDGLIVYPSLIEGRLSGYTQIFRDGSISFWRCLQSLHRDELFYYGGWVSEFIQQTARKASYFFEREGIAPPMSARFGLRDLQGYDFVTDGRYGSEVAVPSQLGEIESPSVWIEDVADLKSQGVRMFSQGLDLLWQAHGIRSCPEAFYSAEEDS